MAKDSKESTEKGMKEQQELQQKFMQFQMLQKHIEQISEHLQMFAQQAEEIEMSASSLQELGNVKNDTEILCPVTNGIFLKAVLKDNQKLLVNVGADTTVEKTIPQVVEMLGEQRKKVLTKVKEGEQLLQNLHQQGMQIYQDIESIEE